MNLFASLRGNRFLQKLGFAALLSKKLLISRFCRTLFQAKSVFYFIPDSPIEQANWGDFHSGELLLTHK
jgi:hypothetical protein